MLVTKSEAAEKVCPKSKDNCIGDDCMLWEWSIDKGDYFTNPPHGWAPTCGRIENNEMSFEKGSSGTRVVVGEALGYCGLSNKR